MNFFCFTSILLFETETQQKEEETKQILEALNQKSSRSQKDHMTKKDSHMCPQTPKVLVINASVHDRK